MAPLPGRSGEHHTPEYVHSFSHTAQGLRGEAVFAAQPAEGKTQRLLFLGDSFTYGLGASNDACFVGRVAAVLPHVEVANTGCNGYTTREELAVLDHFGAAFRPQLVVLVFFWNDLEDNLQRTAPEFEWTADGKLVHTDGRDPATVDPLALGESPPWQPLSAWSVLYLQQLVKEGMKGLRYRWLGIRSRFLRTDAQKSQAWAVTRRLLGLVKRRCEQLGSRLLVVCLPDHNQVDPTARIKNITPFHFEVQAALLASCRELGIECVDLLGAMRSRFEELGRPLYYFADRHLTPLGNEVVGELLLPLVRARL
jgi:hypothetical protein